MIIQELQHSVSFEAVYRASVDGATNYLYNKPGPEREQFIPDLISGDFDSVDEQVLQFYREKVSSQIVILL